MTLSECVVEEVKHFTQLYATLLPRSYIDHRTYGLTSHSPKFEAMNMVGLQPLSAVECALHQAQPLIRVFFTK